MKCTEMIKMQTTIDLNQLKFLKVEKRKNEYIATLVDGTGYEILKGYGITSIEAINDLHSNLV
jgi:hypothetical protein